MVLVTELDSQLAFPDWVAMMLVVPLPCMVPVFPEMEMMFVLPLVKVTCNLEVAVAERGNVPSLTNVRVAGGVNVIVCGAAATVKFVVTSGAAVYRAFPV